MTLSLFIAKIMVKKYISKTFLGYMDYYTVIAWL